MMCGHQRKFPLEKSGFSNTRWTRVGLFHVYSILHNCLAHCHKWNIVVGVVYLNHQWNTSGFLATFMILLTVKVIPDSPHGTKMWKLWNSMPDTFRGMKRSFLLLPKVLKGTKNCEGHVVNRDSNITCWWIHCCYVTFTWTKAFIRAHTGTLFWGWKGQSKLNEMYIRGGYSMNAVWNKYSLGAKMLKLALCQHVTVSLSLT